jgi:hypothetical protein
MGCQDIDSFLKENSQGPTRRALTLAFVDLFAD